MSRVLRAAEGVVYVRGRAPATYLPRALRSLGAMAPRPGPRRARHRTTAPARGAMCCCWSVATPGRQQPAGMHAPTPYYVPTTRSRMHARTPVRAFFDRARALRIATYTYPVGPWPPGLTRTARACTYVLCARYVRGRPPGLLLLCSTGRRTWWYYCTVLLLAAQCRVRVYNCPVCRARRRMPSCTCDPPRPSPRAIQQLASYIYS
jgi:hypothetical protein